MRMAEVEEPSDEEIAAAVAAVEREAAERTAAEREAEEPSDAAIEAAVEEAERNAMTAATAAGDLIDVQQEHDDARAEMDDSSDPFFERDVKRDAEIEVEDDVDEAVAAQPVNQTVGDLAATREMCVVQ